MKKVDMPIMKSKPNSLYLCGTCMIVTNKYFHTLPFSVKTI